MMIASSAIGTMMKSRTSGSSIRPYGTPSVTAPMPWRPGLDGQGQPGAG
jgi:hypothetical protein